jgi:hypothetical protein
LLAAELVAELEEEEEPVALFTGLVFLCRPEQVYLFLLERAEPVVADILLQAVMDRVRPLER